MFAHLPGPVYFFWADKSIRILISPKSVNSQYFKLTAILFNYFNRLQELRRVQFPPPPPSFFNKINELQEISLTDTVRE